MRIATPILFIFFTCCISHLAFTQSYSPRNTYPASSEQLTRTVYDLFDEEIEKIRSTDPEEIRNLNRARKKHFAQLLEGKAIIQDDTLQRFVTTILKGIEESNSLLPKHRYIFIIKDPTVNAHCMGNGVFLINTGLIGRIKTEGQLAFILSHEIAHDELEHMKTKMLWLAKNQFREKQKAHLQKMIQGEPTLDDLKNFRKMNFAFSSISRRKEFQADSLGFLLFAKAGYPEREAMEVMKTLEEHNKPKYPLNAETFLPLHSDLFPFEDYWLNARLSLFSNKAENDYLFNLDSLSTHPDLPKRKATLESFFSKKDHALKTNPFLSASDAIRLAEFETVESAFFLKRYDQCLLQALMLLQKYPRDSYLIGRIAGIFLQLFIAKTDNMNNLYVSTMTSTYSDELRLVNNLLHNLTAKETGELLFHFLKNPDHFDKENKDHYYILWKVCELTYRKDEQNQGARQYRDKFKDSITAHEYKLYTIRKLNIFDFAREWGWVFGI
jgi:hypothetical protein